MGGRHVYGSRDTTMLGSGPHRENFMGCDVDCLTRQETLTILNGAIQKKSQLLHSVINVGKVVLCQKNDELRAAVNAADVINADGQGVVWFARLSGIKIPERVTGIDLMSDVLRLANEQRLRVYLWGAEEHVLTEAMIRIRLAYPSLGALAGTNGFYGIHEEEHICEEIAKFRPDVVFIGMSSPKKELLSLRRRYDFKAYVVMGVGGSFDIWAGITKRAPVAWQRLGLEWLYRFTQEPFRLWRRYTLGNMSFFLLWIKWAVRRKPRTLERY